MIMKKMVGAILVIAALGTVWIYASPLRTLKAMRDAATARDSTALASYVDFPALRNDVKQDIKAKLAAKVNKGDRFGALGELIGGAIADKMIDGLVSPEGLAVLFATGRLATRRDTGTVPPVDTDDLVIEHGLSEFRVRPKQPGAQPVLIFKRSGLSWKLSGIDLPDAG
jgi:Protein of unknown function (DUF2939)